MNQLPNSNIPLLIATTTTNLLIFAQHSKLTPSQWIASRTQAQAATYLSNRDAGSEWNALTGMSRALELAKKPTSQWVSGSQELTCEEVRAPTLRLAGERRATARAAECSLCKRPGPRAQATGSAGTGATCCACRRSHGSQSSPNDSAISGDCLIPATCPPKAAASNKRRTSTQFRANSSSDSLLRLTQQNNFSDDSKENGNCSYSGRDPDPKRKPKSLILSESLSPELSEKSAFISRAIDHPRQRPSKSLILLSVLILLVANNFYAKDRRSQIQVEALEIGDQSSNNNSNEEGKALTSAQDPSLIKTTTTLEKRGEETRTTRANNDNDNEAEAEEEENELSGAKNDDDHAQGCEGISIGESAEGKNISEAQRLVNLQSCIQRKVKQRLSVATRAGMEIFEKLSLTGGCANSLMHLTTSLASIKSFAFKFIDASAKIPSGVMYGLLSDFGDFDQCLSTRSNPSVPLELEAEETGAYSGKYCLMSVKMNYHIQLEPNQSVPEGIIPDGVLWDELVRNYWTSKSPKGFQVGMCFPSRCTNDDLDQLYRHVASEYNFVGELISCQDSLDLKHQYQPDVVQQLIIYTFYALIVVTLVGSYVDRYHSELALVEPRGETVSQSAAGEPEAGVNRSCCNSEHLALAFRVLMCFSVARNWRTFVGKNQSESRDQWDCLTGSPSPYPSSPSSQEDDNRTCKTTIAGGLSSSTLNQTMASTCQSPSPSATHVTIPISESGGRQMSQLTVRIQPSGGQKNPSVDLRGSAACLSHLSGLRLLVIFWITVGHSFLYPSANNYQHYRSIINMNITRDSVWFATTNFTLGIDTLLYMSGLVFVYKLTTWPSLATSGRMELDSAVGGGSRILRLISKKILRFWPTYLTVIALAIVVPLFSDGPMWPEMVSKRLGASCRQNWWSNLLFINNLSLTESEICLPSSWFVSVLMQLFVIGSVIIVLERRYSFALALAALSMMLALSSAYSFLFAYGFKLNAPVIRMDESFVLDVDENIWRLYINILNNMGPFLVGMLGGYLLLRTQALKSSGDKRKLRQAVGCRSQGQERELQSPIGSPKSREKRMGQLRQLLVDASVFMIAVLVLSSVFHQEYSRFWSSLYWSCHRIGWAIVTGYLIHNCATGRWRLLYDLLSLSTFIPFSRLIFIAYLVFPIFIHVHSGLVRDGLHISIYNMLNIYTTRLVMTFATALLIHLLVGLPLCSVEEIFLNKWVERVSEKSVAKSRNSSKCHPLLAVAPVVLPLQVDDMK